MAYGFDEYKNKVEVYPTSEVYSKDDFLILEGSIYTEPNSSKSEIVSTRSDLAKYRILSVTQSNGEVDHDSWKSSIIKELTTGIIQFPNANIRISNSSRLTVSVFNEGSSGKSIEYCVILLKVEE